MTAVDFSNSCEALFFRLCNGPTNIVFLLLLGQDGNFWFSENNKTFIVMLSIFTVQAIN